MARWLAGAALVSAWFFPYSSAVSDDDTRNVISYDPSQFGPDNPLTELLEDKPIELTRGQWIPDARIEIIKHEHKLNLYSGEMLLKTYRIQLGFEPLGDKVREGDGRTPVGSYIICGRGESQRYHLKLQLDYPNETDIQQGLESGLITEAQAETLRARRVNGCPDPNSPLGGDIFIHGQHPETTNRVKEQERGFTFRDDLEPGDIDPASMFEWIDWTLGCIGMTNPDIRELYRFVPNGTSVDIRE